MLGAMRILGCTFLPDADCWLLRKYLLFSTQYSILTFLERITPPTYYFPRGSRLVLLTSDLFRVGSPLRNTVL